MCFNIVNLILIRELKNQISSTFSSSSVFNSSNTNSVFSNISGESAVATATVLPEETTMILPSAIVTIIVPSASNLKKVHVFDIITSFVTNSGKIGFYLINKK